MGTETFLSMILDTPTDDLVASESVDHAKNDSYKGSDVHEKYIDEASFVSNNLTSANIELSKDEIKTVLIQSYLSPRTGYGKYNLVGTLTQEINNLLSKKKVKRKNHRKKKRILPMDNQEQNQNRAAHKEKKSLNKQSVDKSIKKEDDDASVVKKEWIPSDHRLDNTKNEYILAWIRQKDEIALKKRQEIKKERKQKKLSKEERLIQSEVRERQAKTSFKRWLRIKKREEKSANPVNNSSSVLSEKQVVATPQESNQDVDVNHDNDQVNEKYGQQDEQAHVEKASVSSSKHQETPLKKETSKVNQRRRKKKAKAKVKDEAKQSSSSNSQNHLAIRNDDISKKRISYDEWLKQKSMEDNMKKKMDKNKDSSYDEETSQLISKVAKKRMLNILASKKKVDCGQHLDKVKKTLDNPYSHKY
ncbi:uncharacterized protein TRIADDRAFT_61651 [Trichoplax adhaerens]|uniref:Uncharacterized protein n=1 Tax=Trichoplax adhaerens TaxID=10228 RepID=B3SBK8_TRIAD|nr:predicted protein [Trichoplax adhaerens]EDV19876.1 predicted protein [Trichoplax adhaerens]|eukprot:XP_002117618.1 predicted protein [Trichoplax adhaerens]